MAIAGVLAFFWFRYFLVVVPRRMRAAVTALVTARGWTIVSLEDRLFFSLLAERNTRRWNVTVQDVLGRTSKGIAQTSLFTGTRWIKEPDLGPVLIQGS